MPRAPETDSRHRSARSCFGNLIKDLEIPQCPFANLPAARSGRWGEGLTAEKMNECRWLKPLLVGQFEFLEWTQDRHLRHTRFIGLGEGKL
jgi:bifunctional non-homologous end joining protein LigD